MTNWKWDRRSCRSSVGRPLCFVFIENRWSENKPMSFFFFVALRFPAFPCNLLLIWFYISISHITYAYVYMCVIHVNSKFIVNFFFFSFFFCFSRVTFTFARLIASQPVYTQRLLVLLFGTFRVIASNAEKIGTGMTSEAIGVSVAPSFFQTCVSDGKIARMEDVQRFKVNFLLLQNASRKRVRKICILFPFGNGHL